MPAPVPISVNLSRKVLRDENFLDEFEHLLSKYGISKDLIELEITESVLLSDKIDLKAITEEIHNRGFKILVDDFGTGYSSLMMLKSNSVDAIKLDKSFIDDYTDFKGSKIITSVIDLAKKLQLPITAEGVETKDQYDFLLEMDCDTIQGYYFSKPITFELFQQYLETNK